MISRPSARSAASLLTLALIGTVIAASVRTNTVSEQIAALEQIPAPRATAGIDIPALATTADAANLPLLAIHDPI